MNEITVHELKKRLAQQNHLQIVDVREPVEFQLCNIGGDHIPVQELPKQVSRIRQDIPVVVVCHYGYRSAQVINYLSQRFGYDNLLNLKGGINAWAKEIDPEMEVY